MGVFPKGVGDLGVVGVLGNGGLIILQVGVPV